MPTKTISIASPIKGINRVINREDQDPATCWDALNILPFDAFGRGRVAERFGISKAWTQALGSTLVQGLQPVNFIFYSSTGFANPHVPIAVVPVPSSTNLGPSCTWISNPITYTSSATPTGRLGNGSTNNQTRPGWGPGGAGGGGGFGTGGGNADSDFTLQAGTSTAGTVNQATVTIRYGSGSTFLGVKATMTGTGFISPGFSTFAESDQGTIGTPVIIGAPGPFGSSTQVTAIYHITVIPDPANSFLLATVQVVSPTSASGTSTLFSGSTGRPIASPYEVSTHVVNVPNAGSFEIILS